MVLKIFHTGDLHIGMRFGSYPEHVRTALVEARLDVLQRMVTEASSRHCDLFVIAGDLFSSHKPAKSTIVEVANILQQFSGAAVLILPGNHDYIDELQDLWQTFDRHKGGQTLVLAKSAKVSLEHYGLEVDIWPAPCGSIHSSANNLDWMRGEPSHPKRVNIGIAHGTLHGLSPDIDNSYFPMAEGELMSLPPDLWLLGHAHVRYPDRDQVLAERVFNAGTPEPDGLDCRHSGHAWIIEVDAAKKIKAESITTGQYRFLDLEYQLNRDFSEIQRDLKDIDKAVVRLSLQGNLPAEVLAGKGEFYRQLADQLFHVEIKDSRLGVQVTRVMLDREFSAGSFPHRLLSRLSEDEEALQTAYELIKEVKR